MRIYGQVPQGAFYTGGYWDSGMYPSYTYQQPAQGPKYV